jgi:hypothetical protein
VACGAVSFLAGNDDCAESHVKGRNVQLPTFSASSIAHDHQNNHQPLIWTLLRAMIVNSAPIQMLFVASATNIPMSNTGHTVHQRRRKRCIRKKRGAATKESEDEDVFKYLKLSKAGLFALPGSY